MAHHLLWIYLAGIFVICVCLWQLIYARIFEPSKMALWLAIVVFIGSVSVGTVLNVVVVHSLK